METLVKYNDENNELYCVYCKGRINLGEKYLTILEQLYCGEVLRKDYHAACVPETPEEADDEYIINTEEEL